MGAASDIDLYTVHQDHLYTKQKFQETGNALGFFVAVSAKVNVFMYLNGLKGWYNHHFATVSCINIQGFSFLAFLL